MANRWIADGNSYITAPTLGNLLTATSVTIICKDVVWDLATGYLWAVASNTASTRELAIGSTGTQLVVYAGGTSNNLGNPTTIFGGEVDGDVEFQLTLSTGAYDLIYNGSSVDSGTLSIGTGRVDGMLFRIGARANVNDSGTGSTFFMNAGDKVGDTDVYIDGTLDRRYVMPITGTNVPDSESSQDGTLRGAAGVTDTDWEVVSSATVAPSPLHQIGSQYAAFAATSLRGALQ